MSSTTHPHQAAHPRKDPGERRLAGFVSGIDYVIPLLDVGYALIWLPGLVLFLFGVPVIVSAWALAGYAQYLAGSTRRWK